VDWIDPAVGFALGREEELPSSLKMVVEQSPFRNMITPGRFLMSVAMSNCGPLSVLSNRLINSSIVTISGETLAVVPDDRLPLPGNGLGEHLQSKESPANSPQHEFIGFGLTR
jgi:hypothetical protein